jgi:trimeric autotransporter adhesin
VAIELRFNDGELRSVNMTDDSAMRFYMNGTHNWNPQPSSTATQLRYGNDSASYIQTYLSGSFTYSSPGVPISGRVTSVLEYPGFGDWKFSISGLPNVSYNPATWDTWTMFKSVIDQGVIVHGMSVADVLIGGAGADVVYGNGGGDILYGNGGSDSLQGGAGEGFTDAMRDTLYGGPGNDTLDGGAGSAANLFGGPGNDLHIVTAGNWQTPFENPGGGFDTVRFGSIWTGGGAWSVQPNVERVETFHTADSTLRPNYPEHYVYGSAQTVEFAGCEDRDWFQASITVGASMWGYGGSDNLYGSNTSDLLDGGAGDDTILGWEGDDTYVVDSPTDVVLERGTNGSISSGNDSVISYVDWTLNLDTGGGASGDFENLYLAGGAISGTGNAINNRIDGNALANSLAGMDGNDTLLGVAGEDSLYGGEGQDVLDGGGGADRLAGGGSHDFYYVGRGDTIVESARGGIDTVLADFSYTLPGQTENLHLRSGVIGRGNALDNSLLGNSLGNELYGGAGADTLDGDSGADTLVGGDGNDVYAMPDGADLIVETAAGGVDTMVADRTGRLAENVEILHLVGAAEAKGTGNRLDNRLLGNSAANELYGLDGDDFLDGGGGADSLYGADGDDTYLYAPGDSLFEGPGRGYDSVSSEVSLRLLANFEALLLLGTADLDATGTEEANALTGNAGANGLAGLGGDDILIGGAGDDTLRGGLGDDAMAGRRGDDVYFVDSFGDVVDERADGGSDTVFSFVDYTLPAEVESLTLRGEALAGTGNDAGNSIVGNEADNVLDGGAGADTLEGGAGDDILVTDGSDALLDGGSGLDTLRVQHDVGPDLALLGDEIIQSIERIELSVGAENRLQISRDQLAAVTGEDGRLTVFGDEGDTVFFASAYYEVPGARDGFTRYKVVGAGDVDIAQGITVETSGIVGTPGDDVLVLGGLFMAGGLGDDTLVMPSFYDLPLSGRLGVDWFIYGFENVDMTSDGRNAAHLDAASVLAESDTGRLKVTGTAEDLLFLNAADGWESQVVGEYVIYTSQSGAVVEVAAAIGQSVM